MQGNEISGTATTAPLKADRPVSAMREGQLRAGLPSPRRKSGCLASFAP